MDGDIARPMVQMKVSSRLFACTLSLGLGLTLFTGCEHVPAYEQQLVAHPAMQFSGSALLSAAPLATAQLEPGVSSAANAAASGCTTCR